MKTHPNRQRYYQILKAMSPEDRLKKAFELSELANSALLAGLRNDHPDLTDDELDRLYRERRLQCHNRNY
jgi:hypothetical protein